jgi:large subunit ribosomal protein L21
MFVVVKIGGKQYLVREGNIIQVEKLGDKEGKEIIIKEILLVSNDETLEIGKPILKDVTVLAKVLKHGKLKKVTVFKYKKRKGYHKKQGHRQEFTEIEIKKINGTKVKPLKEKSKTVKPVVKKALKKPVSKKKSSFKK